MRTFPEVLKRSEEIKALADMMAAYLTGVSADTDQARLYTRFRELPEAVLDILAYDFKIDWWDGSASLEEKQRVFAESFVVRKHIGTFSAVESIINASYESGAITEWYNNGGEPYTFRLEISNVEITAEWRELLEKRLRMYKNVRSRLERILYICAAQQTIYVGFALQQGRTETINYEVDITGVVIAVTCGYLIYTTPVCGTVPHRSTYGGISDIDAIITTDGNSQVYTPDLCGMVDCGTAPYRSTFGVVDGAAPAINTDSGSAVYTTKACGTQRSL